MFTTIKDYLGFSSTKTSSIISLSDSDSSNNVPFNVDSNVTIIDFMKKLPIKRGEDGEWDILNLSKKLFYLLHNDDEKNQGKMNTIMSIRKLNINPTNNYMNELLYLREIFSKRFNKLKTMENKLLSLQFLKNEKYNGYYIQKVNQLQEWNKQMTLEFTEDSGIIYDQAGIIYDKNNIEGDLTKEENDKLEYFYFLKQKIKLYTDIVIGPSITMIKTNNKKKQEKINLLKKLEELNKEFEKYGKTGESEKVGDALYNFKHIIASRHTDLKENNETDIYLKSKMILHLKNFFDVSDKIANDLLIDFTFDKIINFNKKNIEFKLQMIKDELESYEDIKIADFFYQMFNKTFLCPHCTYTNEIGINVVFHMQTEHKSSKLEPLLVIKPIWNSDEEKYENMYDEFKNKDDRVIYHHMKMNNKIIPKYKTSRIGKITVFEKIKTIKMIPYIVQSTTTPNKKVSTKSFIKKNSDTENLEIMITEVEQEKNLINLKNHVKKIKIIEFLTRKQKYFDNKELFDITNLSDKIIEEGKKYRNISKAYKWVDFGICKYYLKKHFSYLNNVTIRILYDKENVSNFENIDDNISDKIPQEVSINGNLLIMNSKFIDSDKNIDIFSRDISSSSSRDRLIDEIKIEVFMERVKRFCIKLANKLSRDDDEGETSIEETKNILLKIIPNLFRKIIDWEDYDEFSEFHRKTFNREKSNREKSLNRSGKSLNRSGNRTRPLGSINEHFDRVITKLIDINEQNIYNRVSNESEHKSNKKDIDDYLYYLLMAFLPSDNETVEEIYNTIEGKLLPQENQEFNHKNKIWEWRKRYQDSLNDEEPKFKKITEERVINNLYKSENYYLERQIINMTDLFNTLDFKEYSYFNVENKNTNKKYLNERREELVKDFIVRGYQRQLISKIDYKISMALIFLQKLTKALNISKIPGNSNAQVIHYLLRIMDVYIEKPIIYRGFAVKNRVKNRLKNRLSKFSQIENREVLNDFMDLKEEDMKEELKLNNELGGGSNNINNINIKDEETELEIRLKKQKYDISDDDISEENSYDENKYDDDSEDLFGENEDYGDGDNYSEDY